MKIEITIFLFAVLFLCSANATSYPYDGIYSFGEEQPYPAYAIYSPYPFFAVGNNTTSLSQIPIRSALFRPQFLVQGDANASAYSHPLLPLWSQYSFFLPFLSYNDWSFGSYDGPTPSIKDFLEERKNSSSSSYDTPTVRQFVLQDGYREGIEAHDDPSRMGINHFRDDDEPPGQRTNWP